MFEKIKAFFDKKIVKIIEAVIIALSSAGLIIGGVSTESIAKLPVLALGIIAAIEALISFIQGLTTNN